MIRKKNQENIKDAIYTLLKNSKEPMYVRHICYYLVRENLANNVYISTSAVVQWLKRDPRFLSYPASNGFKKWGIKNENE